MSEKSRRLAELNIIAAVKNLVRERDNDSKGSSHEEDSTTLKSFIREVQKYVKEL